MSDQVRCLVYPIVPDTKGWFTVSGTAKQQRKYSHDRGVPKILDKEGEDKNRGPIIPEGYNTWHPTKWSGKTSEIGTRMENFSGK